MILFWLLIAAFILRAVVDMIVTTYRRLHDQYWVVNE